MQTTTFDTLRDLVLHHAARRGWQTQRHVAVMCGLDESALSRFLNGEQDIGARRTHALFQAVGVPVEQYDLAYALLGRAQQTAAEARQSRLTHAPRPARAVESRARLGLREHRSSEMIDGLGLSNVGDIPAAILVAHFAAEGFSGEQTASYFAEEALLSHSLRVRPLHPTLEEGNTVEPRLRQAPLSQYWERGRLGAPATGGPAIRKAAHHPAAPPRAAGPAAQTA